MVFVLVIAVLAIISVDFILFSTSVIFELNVAVCIYAVKLDLVANPLTFGLFFYTIYFIV